MKTPSPSELLNMRHITHQQMQSAYNLARAGAPINEERLQKMVAETGITADTARSSIRAMVNVSPEQANLYMGVIETAVPFWWDDTMLALAMASPLPANYTVPQPPFEACWMAFSGTDDKAWGSVLYAYGSTYAIAVHEHMRARYPNWAADEFGARLLIFLASPYIETIRHRPKNRTAQKRLTRLGIVDQTAHYVVLRQPISPERYERGEHKAYDHRWFVRGHYRNQWYPSQDRHQTIWIAAYIKGPADKPIKEPTYRVAR